MNSASVSFTHIYASTTSSGIAPTTGDALLLTWKASANYGVQMWIGNTGLWMRYINNGSFGAWKQVQSYN